MRVLILIVATFMTVPALAKTGVVKSAATALGSGIGADRTFGIGGYVGQPSGLTGKLFLSSEVAVAFTLGAWLNPHQGGVVGADLLYHLRDFVPSIKPFELGFYFGAGAGVGWWSRNLSHEHTDPWPHGHRHDIVEALVYLRPLAGIAMWFRSVPMEVSLEIAPSLRLIPEGASLQWGGGLAGRYYF